jgi:adenosylmethionine---8-amino-7-oxononanoate aminotransferase
MNGSSPDLLSSLIARDTATIWHPFTQHGLARPLLPITGAGGPFLRDESGREYLDMISSWWVNLHGHGRPEIARAVCHQILNLDHILFAGTTHEPAVRLAERLLDKAGLSGNARVFYSDNGSTAVESALKIAHQHWVNRGNPRRLFATLRGAYHGDTVGAMSVGRTSGFFEAFGSLLFETISLPVPLIWNEHPNEDGEKAALDEIAILLERNGESLAGLIVEPLVQGAGGMRFHSVRFLSTLCAMFRERGIPVIFDEVMTGFGRTGSFFAFQQTGFVPDMICLSKGITGGILPLAVTIASNNLFDSFLGNDFSKALAHGHSYTANPVSCAAALASLDLHEGSESSAQVARINRIFSRWLDSLSGNPLVEKTRCRGGIAAFDLAGVDPRYSAGAGREFAEKALENGILIRPMGNVVYLMPPYCVTDSQLEDCLGVLKSLIDEKNRAPAGL